MTSAPEPESHPPARPGRRVSTVSPPAAARIPNQRHFVPRPGAPPPAGPETAELRELARAGRLGTLDETGRRRLYAAAYAVAYPIVFQVVTRRVERRRGHGGCCRGLRHLDGPCLDGFYDDVEATIEHLFATTTAIEDLEAWLAYWAPRAAVDGHRRRRSERGALQRPRMTKALAARLGHDRWLMELAVHILTWVGVPATAGTGLWPLDEWARERARVTGDFSGSTAAVVAAEVERVLVALRRNPDWYAAHVERPLGHKPAPVAPLPENGAPAHQELDDAHVAGLAGAALEAITAGLRHDRDPAATVIEVLTTLFLQGAGAETMDRVPGAGHAGHERVSALLADPGALAGVVGRVLRIVREAGR